jgi:hypothetical protein
MTPISKLAFPLFATAALCASTVVAAPARLPNSRTFTTTLTGAAEVPGPGDPDGTGTATVRVDRNAGEVCYEIQVSDIAPATLAHIHRGSPAQAGPIVVHLAPPTDGSSSGCVDVSRTLATEIIQRAGNFYVNVHNAEFPAGAVRGQLV